MKKLNYCFVILLISVQTIFAQKKAQIDTVKPFQKFTSKPFGRYIKFLGSKIDEGHKTFKDSVFNATDTAIYQVYDWAKLADKHYVDSLRKAHPKAYVPLIMLTSKILMGVKLDPGLTNFTSSDWIIGNTTYTISNNTDAVLVAMGINAANVKDYRYHVVQNDSSEIVPWSVPKLVKKYGAKQPFGFLGTFNAPGKKLLIEVVNLKNYYIRGAMVFDWRTNFRPVMREVTAYGADNNPFLLADTGVNLRFASKFDPITHLPLNLKFRQGEIVNIYLFMGDHSPAPYSLWLIKTINGKTETSQLAHLGANDQDYNMHHTCFNVPGKYELVIQPMNKRDETQLARMPFEVLPPPPLLQRLTIIQLVTCLGAVVAVGVFAFVIYYLHNRSKLIKGAQQKAMASLKLNSVRAQLNPHFMFNALTSIQNLMNRHDTGGANHYLSKFAELTREVLNASGKELISLEDELQMITNYLQMEQLRFGFKYTIEVAASINKANTEIPAMLFQPFIENAAKHGVSSLLDKGKITVVVSKQQRNLVLTVTDNGCGFDNTHKNESGFGLKLSNERIELLNQLYKGQPVTLQIDSDMNGTKITVTLTNWTE